MFPDTYVPNPPDQIPPEAFVTEPFNWKVPRLFLHRVSVEPMVTATGDGLIRTKRLSSPAGQIPLSVEIKYR